MISATPLFSNQEVKIDNYWKIQEIIAIETDYPQIDIAETQPEMIEITKIEGRRPYCLVKLPHIAKPFKFFTAKNLYGFLVQNISVFQGHAPRLNDIGGKVEHIVEGKKITCQYCQSEKITKAGVRDIKNNTFQRYQCGECNGIFKIQMTETELEARHKYLERKNAKNHTPVHEEPELAPDVFKSLNNLHVNTCMQDEEGCTAWS